MLMYKLGHYGFFRPNPDPNPELLHTDNQYIEVQIWGHHCVGNLWWHSYLLQIQLH